MHKRVKEQKVEPTPELVKAPAPSAPKPKVEPLGDGQKYFEAPNGELLIGEATADRLWYRAGNMWINPKRG